MRECVRLAGATATGVLSAEPLPSGDAGDAGAGGRRGGDDGGSACAAAGTRYDDARAARLIRALCRLRQVVVYASPRTPGVGFVRISAQIYNTARDYRRLRDAVLEIARGAAASPALPAT